MAEGALGIGSSLIYPPGSYASTADLTALCAAAARYGGRYASHVRNEGGGLLAATGEFIGICRAADHRRCLPLHREFHRADHDHP